MSAAQIDRIERIEALVIARLYRVAKPPRLPELVRSLARYAPATLTEAQWRDRLEHTVEALRARGVVDAALRLRDDGELARAIGRHAARDWRQLSGKLLPALGLGVAPDDARALAKLGKASPWAVAIAARALGLWRDGPPPTLPALGAALVWQRLAIAGKPKRCPPELGAVLLQRELGADPAPLERQVVRYAASQIGAPRADARLLCEILVRNWVAGRAPGEPARAGGDAPSAPRPFARDVRDIASAAHGGVFGDRKVFIAAVWSELRRRPSWAALTLDEFKRRLVAAHRAGELELVRADLVAAMDPELVAASETLTDGASFHFIVRESS